MKQRIYEQTVFSCNNFLLTESCGNQGKASGQLKADIYSIHSGKEAI